MNNLKFCFALVFLISFMFPSFCQVTSQSDELVTELNFCFKEIEPDKAYLPDERIPVVTGCDMIDCCPNCPEPNYFDWQIDWVSLPGMELIVAFENLDASLAKQIKLEANTEWINKNTLAIKGGKSSIKNIPLTLKNIPLAFLSIRFSADGISTWKRSLNTKNLTEWLSDYHPRIDIIQYKSTYQVNRASYRMVFRPCLPLDIGCGDKVSLENKTGNDRSVILLDAKKCDCPQCGNDMIFRAVNSVKTGNLLEKGNCPAETFVFSVDNAVAVKSPSIEWTNTDNDEQKIFLKPRVTVPLNIWVMSNTRLADASLNLSRARTLYNLNRCGITFSGNVHDESNNQALFNLLNVADIGQLNMTQLINELKKINCFVEGQLNVFYLSPQLTTSLPGLNGLTPRRRNIIFIRSTASNETLSHELGHAFNLRHINSNCGFSEGVGINIMFGGMSGRNHFTIGQAFRVHLTSESKVNANGHRNGFVRDCDNCSNANNCPPINFDIEP